MKAKICSKCKKPKLLFEFSKSSSIKGGYQNYCKVCHSIFMKKYHQTEKDKEARKKYYCSKEGKEVVKRSRARNKLNIKARNTVNNAIQAGKLPRPNNMKCGCGAQAKNYHHDSYEPKNWLIVTAMCAPCHRNLHCIYK